MTTIAQSPTLTSNGFFVVEKETPELDWKALDISADNKTKMVKCKNFISNFKNSAFGHYFNDSFYDQSQGLSRFEQATYVYAFTMLIAFKFTDINFDIDNNAIADYARQYEEIADIEELTFIFECAFNDANLTQVKSSEDVYIEITSSANTATKKYNVADITVIEKLNSRLWNSPDYCTNVRERVIYFIFEDDYTIKKYNIDLETVVKDYKGTQKIIKDFQLVDEMQKI
jgi:hypothetical protein